MEENTQEVTAALDSAATAPAGAPQVAGGEKQSFIPFFNEEYRFRGAWATSASPTAWAPSLS